MKQTLPRLLLTLAVFALAWGTVWTISSRLPVPVNGTEVPVMDSPEVPPEPASTAPAGEMASLEQINDALADVVERVLPSVVSINTERTVTVSRPVVKPGGIEEQSAETPERMVGSGVLISGEGHILTNWHVVSGEQVKIVVTLHAEDEPRRATLIDHDEDLDIAVLLVATRESDIPLPHLEFGDSDVMRPGHLVIALGNPLNMAETVTQGIISNRARRVSDTYTAYLQTDCVINPGNSGGPLINVRGELIGINTRLIVGPDESPVGQGYGLAIPANDVLDSWERMISKGRPRGYLGVTVDDYPPGAYQQRRSPESVIVLGVEDGSPAFQAGLRKRDIITALDDTSVRSTSGFFRQLRRKQVGDSLRVSILRDGQAQTLSATISDLQSVFALQQEPESGTVAGLSVRDLRKEELARYNFTGNRGVILEALAPGHPLAAKIAPGEFIIGLADPAKNGVTPISGTVDFLPVMKNLAATGGKLYVIRNHQLVRVTFEKLTDFLTEPP